MEQEFLNGINLCIRNIKDFYRDAELLEKNSSLIRSYTFHQFCIEECGRFFLIYNCLQDFYSGKIKAKDLNYGRLRKAGFETHTEKTKINFENLLITNLTFLALSESPDKNDIENNLIKNYSDLTKLKEELNSLKNESLYVSFSSNEFHGPGDNISLYQFARIKNLSKISLETIEKLENFYNSKGGFKKMKMQFIPE